jgi:putative FmdB family regulatory protein
MPIHDYACFECEKIEEKFIKMSQVNDVMSCSTCGKEMKRMMSLPAKTSGKWGDQTGKWGVNGFYDRGLGATYYTSAEREKIARSKGLVPLEDVGGDSFIENRFSAERNIREQQDKILQDYKDKVKEYGGSIQAKVRAIEEVLPAKDCIGETGNVKTLAANSFTGE